MNKKQTKKTRLKNEANYFYNILVYNKQWIITKDRQTVIATFKTFTEAEMFISKESQNITNLSFDTIEVDKLAYGPHFNNAVEIFTYSLDRITGAYFLENKK